MIQIYHANNTNYNQNGDMTLLPTSSVVHAELNGSWYVEMEHPIDAEGRWNYIVEENVVKMPSFNGEQLFRIRRKEKSDSGVKATLEPIFFDAKNDCFLADVRPTNKNGQQALDIMCAQNKKYSGKSDIQTISTAYYEYINLLAAINGDQDNSFVNRWGGEILYDNYTVIINRKIGSDNGVELRYGKNIPTDGLMEEVDTSEVVTRIYPKAFNGRKPTQQYFDSPFIQKYPTVKIGILEFEDVKLRDDLSEGEDAEGLIICNTQVDLDRVLKEKCNEQFTAGLDRPKVTISADMVLLQNTDQYKEFEMLEAVSLGDTIHCRNNNIGIVTDARVIELEYDSMQKKVTSVVLGDIQKNYLRDVSDMINKVETAIREDGTVKASLVSGFIDGVKAQMRAQSTIAKKQNVRAILFEDLDPASPTFGAMALGTMGFQIASERNTDGKSWKWATFGTGKGFFADFITAGTMLADRIKGGELLSTNYVEGEQGFKLDLNNGIIEAIKLIIKTAEKGRIEKGFQFKNGNLEIMGFDGNPIASIHTCGSLPSTPNGLPSGWPDRVVFAGGKPVENYDNGFWVDGNRSAGITATNTELHADTNMDIFVGTKMTMNNQDTKSGRAEFSDGTYLEFVNGVLVGGNSKAGVF